MRLATGWRRGKGMARRGWRARLIGHAAGATCARLRLASRPCGPPVVAWCVAPEARGIPAACGTGSGRNYFQGFTAWTVNRGLG